MRFWKRNAKVASPPSDYETLLSDLRELERRLTGWRVEGTTPLDVRGLVREARLAIAEVAVVRSLAGSAPERDPVDVSVVRAALEKYADRCFGMAETRVAVEAMRAFDRLMLLRPLPPDVNRNDVFALSRALERIPAELWFEAPSEYEVRVSASTLRSLDRVVSALICAYPAGASS